MSVEKRSSRSRVRRMGNMSYVLYFVTLVMLFALVFGAWYLDTHGYLAQMYPSPVSSLKDETKPHPIAAGEQVRIEESDTPALQTQNKSREPEFHEYVLKWGDTLTKLAARTCDTPLAIAKRNGLSLADVIYAGNSIKLKMVEHCSPESVKANAFPEKFSGRPTGASREKILSLESGLSHTPHLSAKHLSVQHLDCARVGSQVRDFDARTLLRAECIRTKYGVIILDAIRTIDPRLTVQDVVAVMMHESRGNPRAISQAKDPCFGLMQLQGGTARDYGVKNVFDPVENIHGGVRVLSDYTFRHAGGNLALGLASYNMGPHHRLLRSGSVNPSELQYVRSVQHIAQVLRDNQFTL